MYLKLIKTSLILTLMTLALSACSSIGPNYQAPDYSPKGLVNLSNVPIAERDAQWWRLFNDPMLNRLIDATLKNNFSVESANANVRAAYAIYSDVKDYSNLSGTFDATYNDAEQLISGVIEQQTRINFARVGTTLNWDLDLFGKIKRARQAARADAKTAEYAFIDLQVSLTATTALRYSDYLNALMRKNVAQEGIQSLEKTRKVVAARTKEGLTPQLDLSLVDAELFGLHATLIELTATAERARQGLMVLTGRSIEINIDEHRDINATYPSLDHPVAIGNPADLLRQRVDVAQAEQNLIASTARIGIATAELYPDISISGFLGFITSDSFKFNSDSTAWSIAPTLSWNVFGLKSIKIDIEVANARQQSALADFKQQVIEALSEAEVALSNYKSTQLRQGLLKQQFNASNDALLLAHQQYTEGAISRLDLLDVRRTQLTAADSLVQAKSQNFSAMINIYLSFGGGVHEGQANTLLN